MSIGNQDMQVADGLTAPKNERGVALLIVLLVTALLIALVFEFAYGTRVSLRAAINFRDSQRAYYLARSGVNFAGLLLSDNKSKGKLYDNLEQRDWQEVPISVGADAELRVRWEDESGKINISNVRKPADPAQLADPSLAYNRLVILFTNKNIDQSIIDQMDQWQTREQEKFYLLTELHQFLSDEDYNKVAPFLTVAPSVTQTDINTASADVLQSIGMSPGTAQDVVQQRGSSGPFQDAAKLASFLGAEYDKVGGGNLTMTSDVFLVDSFSSVGGYTKQIEAIIERSATGFKVLYWRAL